MTGSEPLLRVRGLRVAFPADPLPIRAVDDVDLEIGEGESLGLVGESGCGKSTLARAIAGLESPDAGSIRFEGTELVGLSDRARRPLRRRLQMVFQDPQASLNPRMSVAATLGEPIRLHERLDASRRDGRVCELMERVGLDPGMRRRYPHEFSGGERQRLCIARALSVEPRLILCDEPVSALDVSIQAQILNLLIDLQRELGLAYLFISHDLGVIRYVADRVAVMYLGQLVEEGPGARLLDAPDHPYTRALRAAVPSLETGRGRRPALRGDLPSPTAPPRGCRFHTRCPEAFARCTREAPPLYSVDPQRRSRCFLAEPTD